MAGTLTHRRKLRKSFSHFFTVAPRPSSVVIISSVNIHEKHHTRNNRKILEMQEFKKFSMVQKDAAARLCCYCSVPAWMC